jgi:hypothetical protein
MRHSIPLSVASLLVFAGRFVPRAGCVRSAILPSFACLLTISRGKPLADLRRISPAGSLLSFAANSSDLRAQSATHVGNGDWAHLPLSKKHRTRPG